MSLLVWLIIGVIAGWLASMVMETHREKGAMLDVAVGILGAVVGGAVFELLGIAGVTGFDLWSLFVAFIGAVILLGILRMFSTRPVFPEKRHE
jgi:uncharacterized membrane protein YeaQ/YmgE (transglycosylase-associated protein family)